MLQPIPYLAFNGNCIEAVRFYERVLDAKLDAVVRFSDMTCSAPPAPEHSQLVAHARLVLDGGAMLYAGDCPPSVPYEGVKGVSLTLNYDSMNQARKVFDALSEGGSVSMPMAAAMWAKAAGMVKDRFGVQWIVNGELNEV